MKRRLLATLALVIGSLTAPVAAQRYELGDGILLDAEAVTLRGGVLVHVVEVDGGTGAVERNHPVKDVVRLDWPEPKELAEARRCLSDGDAAGALAALAVVRRQFAPFVRVPGSWWTAASRLQLQALDPEVVPEDVARVARELATLASDPEAVGEARLALTELEIRSGRVRLAQAMLEEVLAGSVSAAIRARAWLLRGDIALAGRRFEEAIEAYLRIPVFHSAYADLIPPALAAAEKAFRAYGDDAQADRVAAELTRIEAASRPSPATAPDTNIDLSTES